jgi:hypothetical protein
MADTPTPATIHWNENGTAHSALWRSERGAAPPSRVVIADDTTTADAAYRLACEGTALLWRGDFHNARQLLQAIERRIDKTPARKKHKGNAPAGTKAPLDTNTDAFNRHRLAQSQRARILGALLLPFDTDYGIALRRAPDARQACTEAWGPVVETDGPCIATLRDLLGMTGAHEWRKKGVAIDALGPPPNNRIYPHYGVFSPVRGEYVDLVAQAPLPAILSLSGTAGEGVATFDIGTGSGVLSAVLARRGAAHIVATDQDARALSCAHDNLTQLGVKAQVTVLKADLFPEGQAALIVCNPPWLPARPSAPVEYAVYDEGSRMLLGFLKGLATHLLDGGEGWLILSDLAEHLGLRSRAMLLAAFANNGLQVLGRLDAKPLHRKAGDATDPLHAARAAEVTSLWRLGKTLAK